MLADGIDGTPRQAAVVFNPCSGTAKGRVAVRRGRAIQAVLAAHGVRTLWYETTKDDAGRGAAQRAVACGIDMLLVCGGDGTVMSCASALVGTSIPLAIIPGGTGNIIAASLRIPTGVTAATQSALHGSRQWIDVGSSGSGHLFFAASIGFGAAVMRDTTPASKARTGMLAYGFSAARHIFDPSGTFRLLLDDQPLVVRKSDGVLVGNFGELMTKPRLPRTALDDGLLEVGILRIRPFLDWLRQRTPVLKPSRRPPLDWYQARRITVDCDRPLPTERDGDYAGSSSHLEMAALPRALVVCAPSHAGAPPPTKSLLHWAARDARKLISGRRLLFLPRRLAGTVG